MKLTSQIIYAVLFVCCMAGAIVMSADLFLTSVLVVLIGSMVFCSTAKRDCRFALLCSGELCCIVAGYILFWFIIPMQIAVIGLVTSIVNPESSYREIRSYTVVMVLMGLGAFFIDINNHVLLPVSVIGIGVVICIIYAFISVFKLKRQYAGENT